MKRIFALLALLCACLGPARAAGDWEGAMGKSFSALLALKDSRPRLSPELNRYLDQARVLELLMKAYLGPEEDRQGVRAHAVRSETLFVAIPEGKLTEAYGRLRALRELKYILPQLQGGTAVIQGDAAGKTEHLVRWFKPAFLGSLRALARAEEGRRAIRGLVDWGSRAKIFTSPFMNEDFPFLTEDERRELSEPGSESESSAVRETSR